MDTLENENTNTIPDPMPEAPVAPFSRPNTAGEQPDIQEPTRNTASYWSAPADVTGATVVPEPHTPSQPSPYPPQAPATGTYRYQYPQSAPQAAQRPLPQQPVQPVQPVPQQGGYYPPRYQSQPCNTQQWNGYTPPAPPVTPPTPPRTNPMPPTPAGMPVRRKGGFWKVLLAAVLVIALVGSSCFATVRYVNAYWHSKTDDMDASFNSQLAQMQAQIDSLSSGSSLTFSNPGNAGSVAPTGDTMTPAQVYNANVQSVVAISSTITTTVYGQVTTGISTGSGFIVTSDGYVVTNYHVVDDASAITVTTNSGTAYSATLIGGDENNDVAVLKVDASGLPCVTIGSSDTLIVGDQVAAIGNPLGTLTNTLTVGYISAKDRAVTTDSFAVNMLQTDAAINSGNSGGPLFNMYGEVVGITSAKYSGESSSGATIEGIGFAIPIDDVIDLIEDLINDGFISTGYLGVSVSDYASSYASVYGLPETTPTGAVVREVVSGYAADRAGVQLNDVVVALGDYGITGVTSLTSALRHYDAGETTTITVYRNGEKLVLSITLDEKPTEEDSAAEPSGTTPQSGQNGQRRP